MLGRTLLLALSLVSSAACISLGPSDRPASPGIAVSTPAVPSRSGGLPAGIVGGVSLGAAHFGDYESSAGDSVDNEDFGFSVWSGYRFTPHVAATIGYIDFGELHATGPASGGFTDDIAYTGIPIFLHGVAGIAPRTAGFASVGALFWWQDVDYLDGFGPFVADENGVSPAIALGVNHFLTPAKTVGVHLEVSHYFEVGDFDATGHDSDITFATIGLLYQSP